MKLPRLRRGPLPEPMEPTSASRAAAPAFRVLAYSMTGLPDEDFTAQTEALRRVLTYDDKSRSWFSWLPLDEPERAADVLTALFKAACVHGTSVQARTQPGDGDRPPAEN